MAVHMLFQRYRVPHQPLEPHQARHEVEIREAFPRISIVSIAMSLDSDRRRLSQHSSVGCPESGPFQDCLYLAILRVRGIIKPL